MKRIGLCLILFTALILLTTCGIPYIYVPSSSDINIEPDSEKGEFSITISSVTEEEFAASSPTLFFFYTIADESDEQNTGYNNVISSFNSSYASPTDGMEISTTFNKNTQPFIKTTTSSIDYGLYQFDNLLYYDISGQNNIKLKLALDTSTGTLKLTDITESEEIPINEKILRYNGKTFTETDLKSDHSEISSSSLSSGSYYLNVYVVVSCKFKIYTNTYNTTISRTAPVYKKTLKSPTD